jgi:hypothetical protein
MRRPTSAQKTPMAQKVEVEFCGMGDITVDYCPSHAVAASISCTIRLREESVRAYLVRAH